jgi:cell division protein FtsB
MKLIKLLFAVIVVLVIANVTLTNRTVDEGVVVANLSQEIAQLQNENTILKAQVAAAGSIGNLSAKLTEAGFVETGKVVSLSTTASVASR